jgi:hypothetical protein
MLDALSAGDVVVTNIKLDWPAVEAYLKGQGVTVPRGNYRYVDSAEIDGNPNCLLDHLPEGGSCLVIDEIHLWLGSRAWRENEAKAKVFFDFLTQARKLSVDCYLITQDERNADAQLARQATHIMRVINWRHLPLIGSVLPLPLTIVKICQPDGKTQVGKEWVWRSNAIGKLYNSKQTFREIKLTGNRAGKVKGARRREMTGGAKVAALGMCVLLLDGVLNWRADRRAKAEAMELAQAAALKAEKEAARVASKRGPVTMEETVPAGLQVFSEDRSPKGSPDAWSLRDRATVEQVLPGVYKTTPFHVTLVGGRKLRPGSYFLTGAVIGWSIDTDSVVLDIDSPVTPKVRLHYGYSSKPPRYDYNGGILGSPGGSDDRFPPSMVPVPSDGPRPGEGVSPGGQYLVGADYKPPAPVIPDSTERVRGGPILGDRLK